MKIIKSRVGFISLSFLHYKCASECKWENYDINTHFIYLYTLFWTCHKS